MGETKKSILSLNTVFDFKKKVLFTLNVFKKVGSILFINFFLIFLQVTKSLLYFGFV